MKEFKVEEKGVSFLTVSGERVSLLQEDFWGLVREGDTLDAEREVLEAIQEMDGYEDGKYAIIESDRELRLDIVDEILRNRIEQESLAEVCEAIKKGLAELG